MRATLGELGERFIKRRQPGLEAQIANLADEIAYNNHDVDDGVRAGLIDVRSLAEVSLFRRQYERSCASIRGLDERRLLHEVGAADDQLRGGGPHPNHRGAPQRRLLPSSIDDVRGSLEAARGLERGRSGRSTWS